MENNEKLDWKPEVGKTAWQLIGKTLRHVEIYGIGAMEPSNPNLAAFLRNAQGNLGATSMSAVGDYLFPTAEAALASIKIYDLEGKEVLIPRASVENSEAPTKLSKEREMELLNLAIAYGDADYQQKDGADRAWHHVAEAREKLIAFVENREPELDGEY